MSSNFRVMIPGNQLTSGYRDPEINWFPGNDTLKFAEFCWKDLLNFAQISRKIHKSCYFKKFLGRYRIDFQVTSPGNYWYPGFGIGKSINFWVTGPGNQLISGYCYPGITRKISPRKRKYFWKYFSMWIQRPGTIDSWKKPEVKNLMLQSL